MSYTTNTYSGYFRTPISYTTSTTFTTSTTSTSSTPSFVDCSGTINWLDKAWYYKHQKKQEIKDITEEEIMNLIKENE